MDKESGTKKGEAIREGEEMRRARKMKREREELMEKEDEKHYKGYKFWLESRRETGGSCVRKERNLIAFLFQLKRRR